MSNIENIFSERRKKEREQRLTYSKYIFNSHLIMFLIIVLGAVLINYSTWLESATNFELNAVYIATSFIFSYLAVTFRVKTFLKEADSVFLLPLEKYYGKVALKTGINSSIISIIVFAIFCAALSPIISKIGNFSVVGLLGATIAIVVNIFYRLIEVAYIGENIWTKILLFLNIFLQILTISLRTTYLSIITIIVGLVLLILIIKNNRSGRNNLLRWNEAAEYDKHRNENYLKFVNMFVDVPLSGIKVARRKYFDIFLPKLTSNNFTQENSFKYYYYRVFLRQENTVFLALRLLVISALISYSFDNVYVEGAMIVAYSYLTIIQLVPLYKQVSNNIWHSILPVKDEIKTKSFRSLLTAVMLITTFVLTVFNIAVSGFLMDAIIVNAIGFVLANLLSKIFIAKIR